MKLMFPSGFGSDGVRHQIEVRLVVAVKAKPFQDAVNRLWHCNKVKIEDVSDKVYRVTFYPDTVRDDLLKCIEEVEKAVMEAVQMRLALELVEKDTLDKLISNMI